MFEKFKKILFGENKQQPQPQHTPPVEPERKTKPVKPLWFMLLNTLFPTVCAIAYICIGLILNLWHPTWLIFLLIPLYYSLIETIDRKDMNYFGYPVLAVGVYLLLGFINYKYFATCWVILFSIPLYYLIGTALKKKNILGLFNSLVPILCIVAYLLLGFLGGYWHPGWVVFFAIPVYYQTVSAVKKYKKEKRQADYNSSDRHDSSRVETMTYEEYEERRRNK